MRLSDAGLCRLQPKLIYPDHQPSPWITEAGPRDRSNRLLDAYVPLNGAFHLSLIESFDDASDSIFRRLAVPS
jgi:hypothetical protein